MRPVGQAALGSPAEMSVGCPASMAASLQRDDAGVDIGAGRLFVPDQRRDGGGPMTDGSHFCALTQQRVR